MAEGAKTAGSAVGDAADATAATKEEKFDEWGGKLGLLTEDIQFLQSKGIISTTILARAYKDEAAFQAHLQAPHFQVFKEAADKWRIDGIQGSARGSKNLYPSDAEWR